MFEQLVLHWLLRPGMQTMSLNNPQLGPIMPAHAASLTMVVELQMLPLHCATSSVPEQVMVLHMAAEAEDRWIQAAVVGFDSVGARRVVPYAVHRHALVLGGAGDLARAAAAAGAVVARHAEATRLRGAIGDGRAALRAFVATDA